MTAKEISHNKNSHGFHVFSNSRLVCFVLEDEFSDATLTIH